MTFLTRVSRRLAWSFCLVASALTGAAESLGEAPAADSGAWLMRPRLLALRGDAAGAKLTGAAIDLVYDPARPVYRRQYSYADLGRGRSWIDPRAYNMRDPHREVFALALSDYNMAGGIAAELPLLASAWVLKAEAPVGRRLLEQLEEVTGWSPLQRAGWSISMSTPLPARDGNSWLATGVGVRALADTLEILGDDPLIAKVRPAIVALLEKEARLVADDWREKRPWFVQSQMTRNNQWLLPTEGLVRAALVVGKDRLRYEYELGVANLLTALDSMGPNGEFDEGISYSTMTVESALSAARAMAAAGDFRALKHPFLKNYPRWYVHHFQPGRRVINAFDCVGVSGADRAHGHYRDFLSQLVFMTGSDDAGWAARNLFDPARPEYYITLLAAGSGGRANPPAPPTFAAYERATRVNWRSSWADDATGVWVRGGHKLDIHDHPDRGHVNFILRGRPVFIEQGMIHYGEPLSPEFAGPGGHNILQLDKRITIKAPAPITVRRLDEQGGEIALEPTKGYRRLRLWRRQVRWDAASLDVKDEVAVREDRTDRMLFTWHTGSDVPVKLSGGGTTWTASWDGVVVTLSADVPIQVTQATRRNGTLQAKRGQGDTAEHAALTVATVEKVNRFTLTTSVRTP
ncbi:MAG: heparinase II/III family protein [Burkholderiales bacterium]|nr:heparinase II/III family protein [Opitutaceae bacterium]